MERDLFEPEHEQYREVLRNFIARNVVPVYSDWDAAGIVPRALFAELGELGALGFGIPEEYGGSGVDDFRYNLLLAEESTRAFVWPALLGAALVVDIVAPYLVSLGTHEQKSRWLPEIAAGNVIGAIAMTEPGTGSDLSGIATRARRDGADWILEGSKTFITNGINADIVIVAARTGEDRRGGLSLFVVEREMPGFERGRKLEKSGMHAQDTAELMFDGVRIPNENVLGPIGGGFDALTQNLAQERLSVAAAAVAASEAALHVTLEYVRSRSAFGKPIGSLQHTRFALAEIDTEIDLARTFADRCVRVLNDGKLSTVDAAKAKWWSTELLGRTVDLGVQLHGGYGYMREYPIARAWADARVQRIYAGTTEIMKDLIGRALVVG